MFEAKQCTFLFPYIRDDDYDDRVDGARLGL
jgi:hypothetical protein